VRVIDIATPISHSADDGNKSGPHYNFPEPQTSLPAYPDIEVLQGMGHGAQVELLDRQRVIRVCA